MTMTTRDAIVWTELLEQEKRTRRAWQHEEKVRAYSPLRQTVNGELLSRGTRPAHQNWKGVFKPRSAQQKHLQELGELLGELVEPSEVFKIVKVWLGLPNTVKSMRNTCRANRVPRNRTNAATS